MAKIQGFILYKIYYNDILVYLGRTKQPLQDRIRGHLFQKPTHRTIHINSISKIEYSMFESEADMNVYEVYFINLYKPPLNVDDKCKDELSITLPDVKWQLFTTKLWDKWKNDLENSLCEESRMQNRIDEISEEIRIVRSKKRMGEITEDECYDIIEKLSNEKSDIRKKLWGG